MAKFFIRNSPEVIQDAIELSMQDFVRKYKPTTSTDEILSKAYLEIRAKHKPKEPQIEQPTEKKVTFKIIKSATGKTIHTKPVIAPIKEEEEEPEISHEQEIENDMLVAKNEVQKSFSKAMELSEKNIADYTEKESKGELMFTGMIPESKQKRGRKSSCDSEKRDARILELLKAGNKGTEIVKIMKEEGYSVFAPQVSNIKAINDL